METNDKLNNQQERVNESQDTSTTDDQQSFHEEETVPMNESTENIAASKQKKVVREIFEWVKAICVAVLLVAVIRLFLFSPFIVEGSSMEPNFHTNERIIVNLIVYDISEPKYGDVVVLDVPEENSRYIKRIIGLPGDTVEVYGDDVYVNGEKIEEPYIAESIAASKATGVPYNRLEDSLTFPNSRYTENIVPEGHYFVMGDNRSFSKDSRIIGFVPEEDIIGRADVVMWPFDKIQFIKNTTR